MKSSIEKGKEFENEVYNFLKGRYKEVQKQKWLSPFDFLCISDNGEKSYIEARLNSTRTSIRPIVSLVATKIKGEIVLLNASLYPKKYGTLTQIDFDEEEEKIIEEVSKKHKLNKPKTIRKIIKLFGEKEDADIR